MVSIGVFEHFVEPVQWPNSPQLKHLSAGSCPDVRKDLEKETKTLVWRIHITTILLRVVLLKSGSRYGLRFAFKLHFPHSSPFCSFFSSSELSANSSDSY